MDKEALDALAAAHTAGIPMDSSHLLSPEVIARRAETVKRIHEDEALFWDQLQISPAPHEVVIDRLRQIFRR